MGLQLINQVEICYERQCQRKHYLSLFHAYKNAPYFYEHLDFFKEIFNKRWKRLIDLNTTILNYLLDRQSLLIEICKRLGANAYVSLSTAKKYINKDLFQREDIEVRFYPFRPIVYPQLWGDFIPNLSLVDLLLNCGQKALAIIEGNKK